MKFEDVDLASLDLEKPDNLIELIAKYLCGRGYDPRSFKEEKKQLLGLIATAKKVGFDYRQFNELLLLLNQDVVREGFFNYFFNNRIKTLGEMKKGITNFRGFAMLCFGNFRFAYRQLTSMNEDELKEKLGPCCIEPHERMKEFEKRGLKVLNTITIPRDQTWYLGTITGGKVEEEIRAAVAKARAEIRKGHALDKEFLKFIEKLLRIDKQIKTAQKKALTNTDVYLTSDYIDVYVATSMRNVWEFEETYDFLKEVFEAPNLKNLGARYFDPTQSICSNSRDKGLLEGLMLRRASCAIYLAQESDTLGKDSELASTLAQGKPVIAYVPQYNSQKYSKTIAKYPLRFFKKRLQILSAEEIFEEDDLVEKLSSFDRGFDRTVTNFLKRLERYRSDQPFTLWTKKDEEFKKKCPEFARICRILAEAECYNFNKRADLFKGHPLCLQVDLRTGVANGVLVARSSEECAELLYRVLTNKMEFRLEHESSEGDGNRGQGCTSLKEKISECAFRVVTDHEKLTNSFWNFFLNPQGIYMAAQQ